jgi:hypothetical protein
MNFDIFALDVARISNTNEMQRREHTVEIEVHRPGSIGGTPAVAVSAIFKGFDWDCGRVIICPKVPLTELTPEQVADITASVRKGQSWHAFEAYKKHKAQLENAAIEHAKVAGQRDDLLAALVSLVAVARRYLPDYDEHPEVQKADAAIDNVKGGTA